MKISSVFGIFFWWEDSSRQDTSHVFIFFLFTYAFEFFLLFPGIFPLNYVYILCIFQNNFKWGYDIKAASDWSTAYSELYKILIIWVVIVLFFNFTFTAVPLALQQIYKFLHVPIFHHMNEKQVSKIQTALSWKDNYLIRQGKINFRSTFLTYCRLTGLLSNYLFSGFS